VPDAYRGEILVAYLSPAPGRAPSDEELQEHCKANLAPYKVPARFERMPVLPRTTVGKLDKVALRDLARRAAGTP
jgi:long-chain acyl-CoA synthetase